MTWLKTTAHFAQNNTSLSIKQHVTFYKTTRHFTPNDGLFLMHSLMQKQTQLSNRNWAHIIRTSRSVKSSKIPTLTRARLCALQEFLSFCCHKCHRTFPILLCSNTLQPHLEHILTDERFNHSTSAYRNNEKHFFRPFLLLGFSIFFFTFSLLVWHLWQQKN